MLSKCVLSFLGHCEGPSVGGPHTRVTFRFQTAEHCQFNPILASHGAGDLSLTPTSSPGLCLFLSLHLSKTQLASGGPSSLMNSWGARTQAWERGPWAFFPTGLPAG